ncbi:hypothetical protein PRIPAC_86535 [Pristionchus pacificus]|uniref:Uncharacterized protein n=1 Tax=Pristionchus pacificus TaxID=54126 RepID=A0A2A6BUQ3_PRIPA|nr:hypothetical protein PRIPAC_86535 [Pristionchus pacificus]|eukprot:PDM69629.1 hypothetical protein PRIPAC_44725 [Pristionchus pacificus]
MTTAGDVHHDEGSAPLSSLAVRMQKKLAGRLANNKRLGKQVLPERAAALFDSLHALLRDCCAEKEQADKLAKYAMKLTLKVGVLAKNGLLDGEREQERLVKVKNHCHALALAVCSFATVAYSYERDYIMPLCGSLRAELAPIVDYQLSDKSSARLAYFFDTLCTPAVMDELFRPAHDKLLKRFAADIDALIESQYL